MNQNKHKKILHIIVTVLMPLALGGAAAGGTVFVLKTVSDLKRDPETSPITYEKRDENETNDESEDESSNSNVVEDEFGEKTAISEKDIPDTLPTTTKDNYKASEVAFEKKITVSEKIAFSTQTVNEANLQRGKTVISQKGVDGSKRITYLVKYNSVGESLAMEKVSEEITKAPVPQIKKVGTSDYNLNDNITVTNYASGVCLPADSDANGCKRNGESYSFAQSFELLNTHYVTLVLLDSGNKSVFQRVSGGSFSFDGKSWVYETRYVRSTTRLTEDFCSQYGFACGKW